MESPASAPLPVEFNENEANRKLKTNEVYPLVFIFVDVNEALVFATP